MLKLNKSVIKGSLILLVLFGFYNLLNFLFQAAMAYNLSIADYGILGALFYIIYFCGIFSEAIQTVITKYSASENDDSKIKNIIKKSFKSASKLAFMFFAAFLLLSILLSSLTKIPYYLFALSSLIIFAFFFLPITRGVLLGKKKFLSLGSSLIMEAGIKIVFGLIFVLLGLKVFGAMLGTVIGLYSALLFTFIPLRKIISSKEKKAKTLDIRAYSWKVFIALASILAFYTLDILIAQIVFTKIMAGYYTLASLISKSVFWGSQPISKAMFPITSENSRKKNNKENKHAYLNALILTILLVAFAVLIFYFFSPFIIKIFSGKSLPDYSMIVYLALGSGLLGLANLNVLYKASIGKIKNSFLFVFILLSSIILLFVFSSTLKTFALAFFVSSVIFLIGSIMLR